MQRYKDQNTNFRDRNKIIKDLGSNLMQIYEECTKLFRKGSKVPYEQLNWGKINDFMSRFQCVQEMRKNILPNDPLFDLKKEEIKTETLNLLKLARSIIDEAFLRQNRLLNQLQENEKLNELESSKIDIVALLNKQEKILDSNFENQTETPNLVHQNTPFFSENNYYHNKSMIPENHLFKDENTQSTLDPSITAPKMKVQSIHNQNLTTKKTLDSHDTLMDNGNKKTVDHFISNSSNLFEAIHPLREQELSLNHSSPEPYHFVSELKKILLRHKENSECSKHQGLKEIICIFDNNEEMSQYDIYQKIQKIINVHTKGWLDWYGKSSVFGSGRNQVVEALYQFIKETLFDDINDKKTKAKDILKDLNILLSITIANGEFIELFDSQDFDFKPISTKRNSMDQ